MNIKLFAATFAVLTVSAAQAQLFNAGESFTFHFNSLPITSSGGGGLLGSYLFLTLPAGVTSIISYEIFSSLPAGVAAASGIWAPGDITAAGIPFGIWNDFEGSFRFTILSGSQVIESAFIHYQIPAPGGLGFDIYQLRVTPPAVPEQSTSALGAMGALVIAFCLFQRARGKHLTRRCRA